MRLDGTQFFSSQKSVFTAYLGKTDQKRLVAKTIATAAENLFDGKTNINMLCIGGGTGEADLAVAAALPDYFFEIENIDPSRDMCYEFAGKAKRLKNGYLRKNKCAYFEAEEIPANAADLILCVNSVYFLKNWQVINNRNPLLKIFNCLKSKGLAAIVLRSDRSDHYSVRKLAGAAHTSGLQVRQALSLLKVPYYWETIESEIDISGLFNGGQFEPNEQGRQLLEFMSKGRWKNFSPSRQNKIARLIQTLKIGRGNKTFLRSGYEIIWIRKIPPTTTSAKDILVNSETQKIARKTKPFIRSVPDFPVKGIVFRDTSLLLRNPKIFREIISYAADRYKNLQIDYLVAKDMQGVLWAGALARELGVGIIPTFRKDVVPPVLTTTYSHEYNPDRVLNLPKGAIKKGDRVLIVDYMVATGATVINMGTLIEHLGGKVAGVFSLMELSYLNPRILLPDYQLHTIIKYATPDET